MKYVIIENIVYYIYYQDNKLQYLFNGLYFKTSTYLNINIITENYLLNILNNKNNKYILNKLI